MAVDLSDYALCGVEDVVDFMGLDTDAASVREDTIKRVINACSKAIPRRAQRNFVKTTAETAQTRYALVTSADLKRGFVRVGDLQAGPTDVSLLTPDRDTSFAYDLDNDLWLMPDTPEPGFPFEYVKIKNSASTPLTEGWWLSVTGDWGFPEIPDDIIQIAIGTAASWVLNDVMALTQLAREQGRKLTFESLIPAEYEETVDGYRLYRVS